MSNIFELFVTVMVGLFTFVTFYVVAKIGEALGLPFRLTAIVGLPLSFALATLIVVIVVKRLRY